MKILISGHNGFLGRHLIRKLKCLKGEYDIDFLTKADFKSNKLTNKISPNDIIFHFAGVNRDINDDVVFEKNNSLNELLLSALVEIKFKGKLLFTSSVQENSGFNLDNWLSFKSTLIYFGTLIIKLSFSLLLSIASFTNLDSSST